MRRTTVTAPLTALFAATTLVAGLLSAASANPAAAADQTRDGLTAATALASCWDVKQTAPASPSGLYWLYTPTLGAPQQFYCDQTTDGGGWVLVGRGREGWSFLQEGQGSAAEVGGIITGPAAFAPKQLTGATVNGLLNAGAVKDLADGIRVRRAADAAGVTWQEVRMRPSTMGTWHWALNGGYPLTGYSIDGVSYAGGTTGLAQQNQSYLRVSTRKAATNNNLPGFAYGTNLLGTPGATSYLWSPAGGGGAVGFAQVFLRPTLRWADLVFPSTAGGLAGSRNRSTVANLAVAQPAGVSGLANGFATERDTEVRSIVQIGDTMFVGGNFAQVNEYGAGTATAHKYLAAFDVATGAYRSSFAPVLDGKVNVLVTLPSGLLAVGGEFLTVNGVPQAGLVVLDPATGQIAPGLTVTLQRRVTTNGVQTITPGTVTALAVSGSTLYLGGQFTHISGGTSGFVYAKRGGRIDATTGRPDAAWNPGFDGTPIFVAPSSTGDRVYYGGFMATMNDGANPAMRFAVVSTASPAVPFAGLATWVPSSTKVQYQQTGIEIGDKFWLGGSEHSFFMYDKATFGLLRGNISRNDSGTGGDFQAAAVDGDVIYGSCHCILSNNYGDGRNWPTPTNFDDIDSLRYVGAYDVNTGRYISSFLPQMKTRAVRGPWALTMDTNGCLWMGGDVSQTKTTAGVWQTSGGFARFCRNDTQAPTVPGAVKAVAAKDGAVTVSWAGSSDNAAGTITYHVFRDDLVVSSGAAWKATLPAVTGTSVYSVRAVDKAGNVSATSAGISITTP